MYLLCVVLLLAQTAGPVEPPPRTPAQVPLRVETPLTHVSAARELPDGRILLTDATGPAVLLLDPSTGAATRLGAPGAGPGRYARPGGLYPGPDGTTLLVDRGQVLALTISAAGTFEGSRSIAVPGWNRSTDRDVDLRRLDGRGAVYYLHQAGLGLARPGGHTATIVRFDPDTRQRTEVATIRTPEVRSMPAGDNILVGRTIVGSPADGWGVAPDGRVAIVRADPYLVEWHAPDGSIVRGQAYPFERLPMTDEDKQAFIASTSGRGPSIARTGGAGSGVAGLEPLFAGTKPPFAPEDVVVSPEARVWVMRTGPHGARDIIYDVFDDAGRRVDRIALPAGSRIVGFGPESILVRLAADDGRCELRKYRLR